MKIEWSIVIATALGVLIASLVAQMVIAPLMNKLEDGIDYD